MTTNLRKATATQIKNKFGDYLGEVIYRREPILIERHGQPVAVIVEFEEWKRLKDKKDLQQNSWIKRIEQLNDELKKNNPHMKPFSAVELINQVRDEEFGE